MRSWELRRLQQALHFRSAGKNIAELAGMDLSDLYEWLLNLDGKLTPRQLRIAGEIVPVYGNPFASFFAWDAK